MALADSVHSLLDSPTTIGVEAYDGSRVDPRTKRATVVIRRPEAIARLVRAPGELGLTRAYVAGDLDLVGDPYTVLELGFSDRAPQLDTGALLRILRAAGPAAWRALLRPPSPPAEEARL